MAFVPGYEHDVFISYSHANDAEKWITRFHEKLEARLRERIPEINVFRDLELSGNEGLTEQIKRRVRRSAVFVSVVSRSYVQRPWCRQEVDEFLAGAREHGVEGRVFAVRYDDVDPAAYQPLLGSDLLGYEFCGKLDGTTVNAEFAPQSESFTKVMLKLRGELVAKVEDIKRQINSRGQAEEAHQVALVARTTPVVFIAEPPRTLGDRCDELAAFLREGYQFDLIRPGAGFAQRDGYVDWYRRELARADLFVQLLGAKFLSYDLDDSCPSWDQWQYRQAVDARVPVERWFQKFDKDGRELELQKLEDDHRRFVTDGKVWSFDFQDFKTRVRDEARQRALARRQRPLADDAAGPKPLIVIRSDKSDVAFVEELLTTLRRHHCEAMRVPDKEIESLEKFATEFPANGLLVVYRASPGRWVLKRLQELRRFLESDIGRQWTCGLWKQPLDDDDPVACALDGVLVIDPHTPRNLEDFVAAVRNLGGAPEVSP